MAKCHVRANEGYLPDVAFSLFFPSTFSTTRDLKIVIAINIITNISNSIIIRSTSHAYSVLVIVVAFIERNRGKRTTDFRAHANTLQGSPGCILIWIYHSQPELGERLHARLGMIEAKTMPCLFFF